MKRFVYAPDIEAYIQTNSGIIDVSNDIIDATIVLRLNAVSNATLMLQNPHRKYLGVIHSMDPIIIYLTRLKRQLVFSGYVDMAPIDQLYPEPVEITASCTLKRLLHTYWNPQLPYVEQFLSSLGWTLDPFTGNILDNSGKSLWNLDAQGSLGNMLQQILHKVGGWDLGVDKKGKRTATGKNSVQILALPKAFIDVSTKVLTQQKAAQVEYQNKVTRFLNSILTVNGLTTDPYTNTSAALTSASDSVADANPLPARLSGKYKAKIYGPHTNLSGFAAAFQKEAGKLGYTLTTEQCQNASTIIRVMKNHGFSDKAAAAFVAVAWRPESALIANRIQGSSESNPNQATTSTPSDPTLVGYGLFQLTGSAWYGSSGYLAQAVRALSGKDIDPALPTDIGAGSTPDNTYAYNPTYNATARAISIRSNDKDQINNSTNPVKLISIIQAHGRLGAGLSGSDEGPASAVFPAIWQALQDAQDHSSNNSNTTSGAIGDIKVGDPHFLVFDPNHQEQSGYTFKINPNPYRNDTFIFQSVAHDPSLGKDEIAIWIPLDSSQAQDWKTQEVSVETSINLSHRFPASTGGILSVSGAFGIFSAKTFDGIDQGVDFNGSGPIPALDDCIITNVGTWHIVEGGDWPVVHYKLLNGKHKGKFVYVMENWKPSVKKGDTLRQGESLGIAVGKFPYIEIGFADGPAGNPIAPLGGPTDAGNRMWTYIQEQFGGGVSEIGSNPTTPDTSGSGIQFNSRNFAQAVTSYGMGLPLVFPMAQNALEAQFFTGERAYQDAQPLMDLVNFICKASGRSFKSTHKGDFFAFYPDYFNWAGESPYFILTDIETQDLTINFSDEQLATHVYTTADTLATGTINITEELYSTVASVESLGSFPELVNTRKDFKSTKFLQKFGARPLNEQVPEIKNSFMQFMYGWMTFLEQWARLFQANPTFTFMPELIPGGLVRFQSKDLTMFVNEVTHNCNRQTGFTTTAQLIAPSTSSQNSYSLMVLSGGGISSNV